MSKQEYERLLGEFRKLAVQVGSGRFDLQWHRQPHTDDESKLDENGGDGKCLCVEQAGEVPAFDAADRLIIGQLGIPADDREGNWSAAVTIPRGGVAVELVTQKLGEYYVMLRLADRFHSLSAEAGAALPPEIRGSLTQYWAPPQTAPESWWYALLLTGRGIAVFRQGAVLRAHEGEFVVDTPLQLSCDLIQRLRLNTDEPRWPEEWGVSSESKSLAAGLGKGRRGPKGPRYDAEKDEQIFKQWKLGSYRKLEDFARKMQGANSPREIKAVRDAIERERTRRRRKVRK